MKKKLINNSINFCLKHLKKNSVIAYPTESIFGFGCDPDNLIAIYKLLKIKKRSIKKGLILIASDYEQFIPYIEDKKISFVQKKKYVLFLKKLLVG